jgi:hypothetical protein
MMKNDVKRNAIEVGCNIYNIMYTCGLVYVPNM